MCGTGSALLNIELKSFDMEESRRSNIDRRSGVDRRKVHNLDYFLGGGVERRSWKERRQQEERRADWMRIGEWNSVYVGESRRDR